MRNFAIVSCVFASLCTLLMSTADAKKSGLGSVFAQALGKTASFAGRSASPSLTAVESALRTMVNEANRGMPVLLDQDTRMDSLVAGPGAMLTYMYTLTTLRAGEVDRSALEQRIRGPIKLGVCSAPDLQEFFQYGVTLRYYYRGSDGGFAAQGDVTPKDCGYPK